MKMKGFFSRNKLIFAAFFLPVLLMTVAFAVMGIYPFGGNQIAVIDMYHQYVPFLSELQYKLQEGGSLFYTWDGAGGSNFWNLLAYYGASPLNLLLAIFPQRFIMEGVTAILLIKIGLAGSFMAMYLRYLNKACDGAVIAFATLYALSSYVMAYYWCIMWMDAVALLPLCILGLNRLMDQGKAVMYTVSLALIVATNYYISIMVCIFILFYYPVLYFTKNKWRGVKSCAAVTGRAVGFSLLAILMASVMLLPTYISMQSTYYIAADMPDNTLFYSDALDIVNQILPYSELTFRDGLPNLYCGMMVVILLVFYAVSKSISFREKLINGVFLVFLFLSLNINKLDFIWHGLHFPNQLPYRYTFVICFILIGMAYKAFRRLEEVSVGTVWTVLAVGVAYYMVAQKLLTENIEDMNLFFYGGIAWLALYCVVIVIYRRDIIRRSAFIMLVLVVVASEMVSGACTSLNTIGNTQRSSYFENYDDMMTLAEESREEFARAETDYNYILNCPALYHYRGMSQFSSSVNADVTGIMEKIGLEGSPDKNRFNYNQTNPVTNALLNVKYLIAKTLPLEDEDFTLVKKQGNSRMYESKYPLSIGYMTGNEIRTWDVHSENPFEVLDSYVRAATSNEYSSVFKSVGVSSISSDNISVNQEGHGKFTTALEDESRESEAVLRYTSDKTQKYYVFVEAGNADEIFVKTGEEEKDELGIRSDCGSIINIGTVEEGDTFDIIVKYKAGKSGDITSHICVLDYETWDAAYEILSQSMLEVTDSGDDFIRGTVDAGDGGVLVTSVPYEKGWTLKVDGAEKEIDELTGGVFISTALSSGVHEIELKFRPPGFTAGLIITCLSILALAGLTLLRKRILRKRTLREYMLSNWTAKFLSAAQEDRESPQEVSDCSKR